MIQYKITKFYLQNPDVENGIQTRLFVVTYRHILKVRIVIVYTDILFETLNMAEC